MKIIKIFELIALVCGLSAVMIALVCGLSAVILETYCLIDYNNIYVHEPSVWVRYLEICWGIFSIVFLSKIIGEKVRK